MNIICKWFGHKMTIYESYETYVVCHRCGFHDWSTPEDLQRITEYLIAKYPKAKIVPFEY